MTAIPSKKSANNFSLPVFSIGTWTIGGGREIETVRDPEEEVAALKRSLHVGLSCIDTAELYAAGFTEQLVSRAISGIDREKIQIISKVSPENLSFDRIQKSLEASLKRLNTDYLDVYLVHRPNPEIEITETMRAMRKFLDQGLIKEVGMSNAKVETCRKAQEALGRAIVLNQVHYNLIYREPEIQGVLEYCQENKIILMAWRPIQKGQIGQEAPEVLREMARKYDKTPNQVAINWLISQPMVVTLSTMRSPKHLEENLGGLGWTLEKEDIELLRREFPNQQSISNSEPLL